MFAILGTQEKYPLKSENLARKHARRSLVTKMDISEGTIINREHLTWKRPAHGISPRNIDEVLGKKTKKFLAEDEVLQWKNLIE